MTPVFNDWEAFSYLLAELDKNLGPHGVVADILAVDDGSPESRSEELTHLSMSSIRSVEILRLHRNLGHQRAIAIGLAYVSQNLPNRTVVVMDADGEDQPAHLPLLIEAFISSNGSKIIFAERRKRLESTGFRLGYALFRWLHFLLVGVKVRVGNFSIIPPDAVSRLAVSSELWSHYAAAVFRSRYPYDTRPLDRGHRFSGRSHMNFSALVAHGLSAISIFADVVGARLLIFFTALSLFAIVLAATVFSVQMTTSDIPSWVTYAVSIFLILSLQTAIVGFALTFFILSTRTVTGVIPIRDFHLFVHSVEQITLSDELLPLQRQ